MSRDPLEGLLGHSGRDPGCDAAFEQFELYCEAARRGENVEQLFPEFVNHIRNCAACREDTEGLLAALDTLDDGAGL